MLDGLPLNGQKTYIIAAATIAYAIGGMFSGHMTTQEGVPLIMGALGMISIRHAQSKTDSPTPPAA